MQPTSFAETSTVKPQKSASIFSPQIRESVGRKGKYFSRSAKQPHRKKSKSKGYIVLLWHPPVSYCGIHEDPLALPNFLFLVNFFFTATSVQSNEVLSQVLYMHKYGANDAVYSPHSNVMCGGRIRTAGFILFDPNEISPAEWSI